MKPYRKPEQRGRLKVKHLIPKTEGQLTHLEEVAGRAKEYIGQAKAANTIKAYRSDWNHFVAWCQDQGLDSLPATPQTVALYLTALAEAGRKASTLQRRLSSISQAHQAAGYPSPTHDIGSYRMGRDSPGTGHKTGTSRPYRHRRFAGHD